MKTPRVGVIGLGTIGQTHIETWKSLGLTPVAVADAIADVRERAANMADWIVYESGEQLIEEGKLDIVSICTPPAFHQDLVIAAVNAGLTVLCEKPLAHTVESAEAIVAASNDAPGVIHVGFCHRFEPAIVAIKHLIDSGELGTIISLNNRFAGVMDHPEKTWFANPAISGGGALADTTIHSIDLFRYLLGDAVQVRSLTSTQASNLGPALGVEDSGTILLVNEAGAIGVLESSWRTPPGVWDLTVYGTKGSARFDYSTGTGTVLDVDGNERALEFERGDRFTEEFRYVAEAWESGNAPRAGVADGAAANRILAMAYEDATR